MRTERVAAGYWPQMLAGEAGGDAADASAEDASGAQYRAVFISDQIGISKPNPKLYALAVRDLELSAEEVMYVGDSPLHDVAPPQSLGMITVWARRAARHKLDGTGIEPAYTVDDFEQLRRILARDFAVALP